MVFVILFGVPLVAMLAYLAWRDHRSSGLDDGYYGHSDYSTDTTDPRHDSYPH